MFDFIIITIAVAGTSILWKNLLGHTPSVAKFVNKIPYPIDHALRCGFCITYWMALVAVIIFNPLSFWEPSIRFEILEPLKSFLHLFVSWFSIGILAAILRFIQALLQETVYHLTQKFQNTPHIH